jgi:HEAT repeat protein
MISPEAIRFWRRGRRPVAWIAACLFLLGCAAAVAAPSDSVSSAIGRLKSRNPSVRVEAATALGKSRDPRAVEPLIAALNDKDESVRTIAALALFYFKDPRAVEPLIAALLDRERKVRVAAAVALAAIKDPRAARPLTAMLQDSDPDVRMTAAAALGPLRDPLAVDPLIGALKDEEFRVRAAAALSLGQLTDERAIDPLLDALGDVNAGVQESAVAALGRFGAPAIGRLASALKSSQPLVRRNAAETLGRIGGAGALDLLAAALGDTDTDVRRVASEALRGPRSEYVIADLKQYFCGVPTQTDVTMLAAADKDFFWADGHMEKLSDGKTMIWCDGARHTIVGTLEFHGYRFASDSYDPLVFRVSAERGYVYERGRGTVTTPAREAVTLGAR